VAGAASGSHRMRTSETNSPASRRTSVQAPTSQASKLLTSSRTNSLLPVQTRAPTVTLTRMPRLPGQKPGLGICQPYRNARNGGSLSLDTAVAGYRGGWIPRGLDTAGAGYRRGWIPQGRPQGWKGLLVAGSLSAVAVPSPSVRPGQTIWGSGGVPTSRDAARTSACATKPRPVRERPVFYSWFSYCSKATRTNWPRVRTPVF